MKSKKKIYLDAKDARAVLRDLNLLVVSLDRLGSEFSNDPQRLAIETDRFLFDIFAFRKLARMRRILTEAYDAQQPKVEAMRMENEKINYWPKHKRVRRKVPLSSLWKKWYKI